MFKIERPRSSQYNGGSTLVGPFVVKWFKAKWVGFCFECEWAVGWSFFYSNGAFSWVLRLEGREKIMMMMMISMSKREELGVGMKRLWWC